jgi:hypothetical protein
MLRFYYAKINVFLGNLWYNILTLLLLRGENMLRNEIIETINQKTLEAKKLINEINDLKKLLNNYDN